MRKIVVTGADGMLGSEVVDALADTHEVVGVDLGELDITDEEATRSLLVGVAPDCVVNCAAYTDVDGAEAERELAFEVNARGAGNVARAGAEAGAFLVHVSTDYVFDGTKAGPYTEGDRPSPINVYGESKLEGEREIERASVDSLIVRTAWLYGHRGRNFVEFVLDAAAEARPLRIVEDQRGAPTNARDLAIVLRELVVRRPRGVIHATNSGSCSWFEFAGEILGAAGCRDIVAEPIASAALDRPAPRPHNSVLSLQRLSSVLGWDPRPWQEALREYVSER